jgi:hypothetical protein
MNAQLSVTEIFDNASRLGKQDFDYFFKKLSVLYAQRSNAPFISIQESELLEKINIGFPEAKWERLKYLDKKMETSNLNDKESIESLKLATAYEKYSVDRLQLLIKLASIKNVSLDVLITDLGINARPNG